MIDNTMTDEAIGIELGSRIKALRLRKDITQQELADATTFSRKSIQSLEGGKAKLTTMIAVLRHLGQLDTLEAFIPEMPASPIQLAKMKRNQRQRGSGMRGLGDVIKAGHNAVTKK